MLDTEIFAWEAKDALAKESVQGSDLDDMGRAASGGRLSTSLPLLVSLPLLTQCKRRIAPTEPTSDMGAGLLEGVRLLLQNVRPHKAQQGEQLLGTLTAAVHNAHKLIIRPPLFVVPPHCRSSGEVR